jgi:hypothetical protein
MTLKLICALPEPGHPGAPQGMFYPDTLEGEKGAKEWAREHDGPGWGVFSPCCTFHDNADDETFSWILEQNGFKR